MTEWIDLERELDAWSRAGQTATFWWRDDDAVTSTPALQRLLEMSGAATGRPLAVALAVIPAHADVSLARALSTADHAVALQHGYSHANHAPAGGKKAEFGVGRDWSLAIGELREGSRRMHDLFGSRALPVLVPPWNRIDPALVVRLVNSGMRGLSTYGPRAAKTIDGGIDVVNSHVDIVDWHAGRRFLGAERCVQLAIGHLTARREGRADRDEPTGLLTHHLAHNEDAWSFLVAFLQRISGHAAVRWMDARGLFGCSNDGPA